MSYNRGGVISAVDYNKFADLIRAVASDIYPGSVTVGQADIGYGQSVSIPVKAVGAVVTAADWTALFTAINNCGIHQGVNTYPIPTSVSAGQLISAYNDYLTTQTLSDVVGAIVASRMVASVSQLSSTTYSAQTYSSTWTSGVQYTWVMDFGSHDNARYFFNTGGAITVAGSYVKSVSPTPADIFWQDQLVGMGTIKFQWHDTIPTNSGIGSNVGFYDLTASAVEVYRRSPVSNYVYYSNDFIRLDASVSGGQVTFKLELVENDNTANPKTGVLSVVVGSIKSSGIYPYPGTLSYIPGAFSNITNTPFAGPPLTLVYSPLNLTGRIIGAGLATSSTGVSISTGGGAGSHKSCRVASTGPLPACTYSTAISSNGQFTATSNGALIVDSTAVIANDRILIKDQAISSQNGIYFVVTPGSASTQFVIERAADLPQYNSAGVPPHNETSWSGDFVFISSGTYATQAWKITSTDPIQIGNTGLGWGIYPAPYFYSWSYLSGASVTIISPSSQTTSISRTLAAGEIASGQIICTVTDAINSNSATVIVPWSLDSNTTNLS